MVLIRFMQNRQKCSEMSLCEAGYRQFTRRLRDEKNMRDAKKALENVKINYARFVIQLFSRTIILSLIARENPFVSCIITASTVRWFKTQEISLVKRHKKYKITCTHVLHLTCFSCLTDHP